MHNANRNYISIIMFANDGNSLKPIVICLNIDTSQHNVRKKSGWIHNQINLIFYQTFYIYFLS